jgi:hypothetical protein
MYSARGARNLAEISRENKAKAAFYKISQSTDLKTLFDIINESIVNAVAEGCDSTSIPLFELTEVMGEAFCNTSPWRTILEDLGYEIGMTFSPDKIKISWSGK